MSDRKTPYPNESTIGSGSSRLNYLSGAGLGSGARTSLDSPGWGSKTNWGKSPTTPTRTSDELGPSSSYRGTLGSATYLRSSAGSPSSPSDLFSFDKSPRAGTGTSSSSYGAGSSSYGANSSSYTSSAAMDSYSRLFRSGDSRSGSSAAALGSSSTFGSGSGSSSWVPALGSSSSTSGLGTSGGYGTGSGSGSSWVPSLSGSSSSGLGAGTSGSSNLYGSSSTYGSGTYGSRAYGSGSGSSSTKKEWWDI